MSDTKVKTIQIDGSEYFATKEELQAMKAGEITVDEIMAWYAEMEADTGIANSEIDEMYETDVQYEEDTGLPNEQIDEMYET